LHFGFAMGILTIATLVIEKLAEIKFKNVRLNQEADVLWVLKVIHQTVLNTRWGAVFAGVMQ
jgi:hypothetical protein